MPSLSWQRQLIKFPSIKKKDKTEIALSNLSKFQEIMATFYKIFIYARI